MKRVITILGAVSMLCVITACSVQKLSTDKLRDLEFVVVAEEIPEELTEMIEVHKEDNFKLTYVDQGRLYIAEGYGKQATSGYSIMVKECFETSNAIYFRSDLIGPSKEETIVKEETYPYIVIQLEYQEKHVVFM